MHLTGNPYNHNKKAISSHFYLDYEKANLFLFTYFLLPFRVGSVEGFNGAGIGISVGVGIGISVGVVAGGYALYLGGKATKE